MRSRAPELRRAAPIEGSAAAALLTLLRARIDSEAGPTVGRILPSLLALSERPMRSQALARRLVGVDTHLRYAILSWLCESTGPGAADRRELLLDLARARPLRTLFGPEGTEAIVALAVERGATTIVALFLGDEARGHEADRAIERRWKDGEVPENQNLPDESLGRRKALARGRDRFALDRLVFDRNPAVIRHLLDNPRTVERDVVRIAAMRPTPSSCLEAVFAHARWVSRHHVKVALASNPWTPPDIAMTLLPHLHAPELKWVVAHEGISEVVRARARVLVEQRAPGARTRGQEGIPGDDDGKTDRSLDTAEFDRLAEDLAGWGAERAGD